MNNKGGKSLGFNISSIFFSQILLSATGFLSIPFISRNLGPEVYGEFSLFLLVVGLLNTFEFGRVFFIKEFSNIKSEKKSLLPLISVLNIAIQVLISSIVSLYLFEIHVAVLIALISLFQALAALDYAWLANNGQIGKAISVRNIIWALAFIVVVFGVKYFGREFQFHLPYLLSNIIIFFFYKYYSDREKNQFGPINFQNYLKDIFSIVQFNMANSIIVSIDRLILNKNISQESFGIYSAQSDFGTKLNMFSNSIGSAIYPHLVKKIKAEGLLDSYKWFKSLYYKIFILYFFVFTILIFNDEFILQLYYGKDFTTSFNYFKLFLFSAFLNLNGFMFVSWSRALGDHNTPKNINISLALLLVVLGIIIIPLYGLSGAIIIFVLSRAGGLILCWKKIKELPKNSINNMEILSILLAICFMLFISIF